MTMLAVLQGHWEPAFAEQSCAGSFSDFSWREGVSVTDDGVFESRLRRGRHGRLPLVGQGGLTRWRLLHPADPRTHQTRADARSVLARLAHR